MGSRDTLRIVQTVDETQNDEDDVFVIEDQLMETTEQRLDEIVNWFSRLDIDDEVPIYETIWHRLVCPLPGVPSTPSALTHLIVLYLLLERRIEADRPNRIVCGDIQIDYRAVVSDLAREYDIEMAEPASVSPLRGYLNGLNGALRRLFDQLFSFLWKHTYDLSEARPTVFVPNINRFGSMRPVLEKASSDHLVAIPRPTLSWLLMRSDEPAIDSHDPVPIDCFVTLGAFLKELKLVFVTLPLEALFYRQREHKLVELLHEEFGVRMETTVAHALTTLYGKNMMALLYYVLAEEVIDRTDCDRMAFGSRGAIQSAMIHTARKRGVETFHIPHTVTIGYETLPWETTYFATGDLAMRHFRESAQVEDLSRIVPAGRPYLRELSEERGQHSTNESVGCEGRLRITIATQPYNDDVRQMFVSSILDTIEQIETKAEVVIKIHPNEETDLYERLLGENSSVIVATGDIRQYLLESDLVVTINSNVGIESIILGTPCVCVNLHSPLLRTRAYAKYSPVPVLSSEQEVVDWFSDLTREKLDQMKQTQTAYIDDHYQLDKDVAGAIIDHMETEGATENLTR